MLKTNQIVKLTIAATIATTFACTRSKSEKHTSSDPAVRTSPSEIVPPAKISTSPELTTAAAAAAAKQENYTPNDGALFGKVYGQYKVVSCIDRSKVRSEIDACKYSTVAIYATKPNSEDASTTISLRKQLASGLEFMTLLYPAPITPSVQKYTEDENSASLITEMDSDRAELKANTTIEAIGTQYKLILKYRNWFAPASHNLDYDFELILEKI